MIKDVLYTEIMGSPLILWIIAFSFLLSIIEVVNDFSRCD